MDDQDRASRLTKTLLTGCGLLVLLLVARSAFGVVGTQVALLVVLAVVLAFAYGELTGRPLPALGRLWRRGVVQEPDVPDAWRSERWIAEAVERGLRAIDEWRLEQRDA